MITTPNSEFKMRTKPYDHQLREWERSRDLEHYGLFWEMGTGKSKAIIDTAAWLYTRGEIDGLLIISDKGAYLNWYYNEVPTHLMADLPHRLAYWSSSMRREEQRLLDQVFIARDDCLDILCMNIEAFVSDRAVGVARTFLQGHYGMTVIDESTSIKNPKAQRTKAAMVLRDLSPYRRIVTGTPITQSPLDMFSQCEFLKKGLLKFPSFVAFRSYYAEMITMNMGSRNFPKIVGYRNLDKLTRDIQPFSSRILKSECLDLPPKVYETTYVEQTPEQANAYDDLKATAVLQLNQGLLTSTSALTTINKLHQINCGHVKMDDGLVVDLPNNRVRALLDLLEVLDDKVIIWCNFQRDVELILAGIKERFANTCLFAVDYYGKTSTTDRQLALKNFKDEHNCRWFVGTAATGGKSLTLVSARYAAYYSNSYVLEDRLQSEDRCHRIGQDRAVTYFDFVCAKTVDVRILSAIKSKKDLASKVLDDFRELVD